MTTTMMVAIYLNNIFVYSISCWVHDAWKKLQELESQVQIISKKGVIKEFWSFYTIDICFTDFFKKMLPYLVHVIPRSYIQMIEIVALFKPIASSSVERSSICFMVAAALWGLTHWLLWRKIVMKGDIRVWEIGTQLPDFIFEQIYIFGYYPAEQFGMAQCYRTWHASQVLRYLCWEMPVVKCRPWSV